MSSESVLAKFHQLKECMTQCDRDLGAIKSPRAEYEEKVAKVDAKAAQAWERLYACEAPGDRLVIQDELMGYGRELNRLEVEYNVGLEDAELIYKHDIDALLERLCDELVDVLELPLVKKSMQRLNDTHRHPSDNTPGASQEATTRAIDRGSGTSTARTEGSDMHEKDNSDTRGAKEDSTRAIGLKRQRHNNNSQPGGTDSKRRQRVANNAIIEPTPDEVYLAYWKKAKAWSAVLLCDISKPGVIKRLGLAESVPKCHKYNRRTDTLSWRGGYEDGGRLVSEREFPVIYFDGLDFPSKSAVGWIAARDLQEFSAGARKLIENYGQVQKFLRKREEKRAEEAELDARSSPEAEVEADEATTAPVNSTDSPNPPPASRVPATGSGNGNKQQQGQTKTSATQCSAPTTNSVGTQAPPCEEATDTASTTARETHIPDPGDKSTSVETLPGANVAECNLPTVLHSEPGDQGAHTGAVHAEEQSGVPNASPAPPTSLAQMAQMAQSMGNPQEELPEFRPSEAFNMSPNPQSFQPATLYQQYMNYQPQGIDSLPLGGESVSNEQPSPWISEHSVCQCPSCTLQYNTNHEPQTSTFEQFQAGNGTSSNTAGHEEGGQASPSVPQPPPCCIPPPTNASQSTNYVHIPPIQPSYTQTASLPPIVPRLSADPDPGSQDSTAIKPASHPDSGFDKWPCTMPQSFLNLLEAASNVPNPKPYLFVTPQGLYRCPFCDDKEWVSLQDFTMHILSQHMKLSLPQNINGDLINSAELTARWPSTFSERLVRRLEDVLRAAGRTLDVEGCRNDKGLLVCPLCPRGKAKEYIRGGKFMTHIKKWHSE